MVHRNIALFDRDLPWPTCTAPSTARSAFRDRSPTSPAPDAHGQRALRRAHAGADAALNASTPPKTPIEFWRQWAEYNVDFAQRSVLFWDTLRQRGNQWLEHEAAGKPPVLTYKYEMIADARDYERPANYALVRIIPPAGVIVDDNKRPFVIVDPRAGHGPGIGGFKEDSEVGVALSAGHPGVFRDLLSRSVPGQTLADVTDAEAEFIRIVAERHPRSQKPVIIGNCQGGWAVMMLAAARPDIAGPLVINGAPMSYWSGNDGESPMRYMGGLLGGAWLSLFASDLGAGKFDGANLVQNFEYLNPANSLWDKWYHLFDKHRHGAGALPRVRTLVGRLLRLQRGGDPLDRQQPLRRQQACRRARRASARDATST